MYNLIFSYTQFNTRKLPILCLSQNPCYHTPEMSPRVNVKDEIDSFDFREDWSNIAFRAFFLVLK